MVDLRGKCLNRGGSETRWICCRQDCDRLEIFIMVLLQTRTEQFSDLSVSFQSLIRQEITKIFISCCWNVLYFILKNLT